MMLPLEFMMTSSVTEETSNASQENTMQSAMLVFCSGCASVQKLFRCARCFTHYCSKECQKKDWPFHKTICKVIAQACKTQIAKTEYKETTLNTMNYRGVFHGKFTGDEISQGRVYFPKGVLAGEAMVLEGTFEDELLQGDGKQIVPGFGVYTGVFRDSIISQGKLEFLDGNLYVGAFKDGKPHGEGKMTYANSQVQVGTFRNGKFLKP